MLSRVCPYSRVHETSLTVLDTIVQLTVLAMYTLRKAAGLFVLYRLILR